jgi:hypothetical protein
MQIRIDQNLSAGCSSIVTIPNGKTWDDVEDWYIKWDRLHIFFKDGSSTEIELDSDTDIIDWKRPDSVTIYDEDTATELESSLEHS